MTELNEIQKLVELFNTNINDSDSDEEQNLPSSTNRKSKTYCKEEESQEKKRNPYDKIENGIEHKNANIENLNTDTPEDIFLDKESADKDWKKTPAWDISYKQQVTAEDIYLQMGLKHPGSASCEDMIIKIELPDENRHNIDLKILSDKLILVSPRFYLDLKLPHTVNPQRGNAQFDSTSETLIVTLRMDREFDLVNF